MPPSREQLRDLGWSHLGNVHPRTYKCPYCEQVVSADKGYQAGQAARGIWICPDCKGPSIFLSDGTRIPDVAPGPTVPGLPDDLALAYREARDSYAAGAYTGAVMLCRKMLMHVAVDKGDAAGKSFADYVTFLVDNGHVPADSKKAVDFVRTLGNTANHQIPHMTREDAEKLVNFTGMLLLFAYAFPNFMQENPPGP